MANNDGWILVPQHLPQDGMPVYALICDDVMGMPPDPPYAFRVAVCRKKKGPYEQWEQMSWESGQFTGIGYFGGANVIAWMPMSDQMPDVPQMPDEAVKAFKEHQRSLDTLLAARWHPVSHGLPPADTLVIIGIKPFATALAGVYTSDGRWLTDSNDYISDYKEAALHPKYFNGRQFYQVKDHSYVLCWIGYDDACELGRHLLARGLEHMCSNLKARETRP